MALQYFHFAVSDTVILRFADRYFYVAIIIFSGS
jgi:hypothetical protein